MISRWSRPGPDQLLDHALVVLLQNMIITSVEDAGLTPVQKFRIEQIQLQHITLLHRYLKFAYPKEANSKLAGGLMMLQYANEISKICSMRLPF